MTKGRSEPEYCLCSSGIMLKQPFCCCCFNSQSDPAERIQSCTHPAAKSVHIHVSELIHHYHLNKFKFLNKLFFVFIVFCMDIAGSNQCRP